MLDDVAAERWREEQRAVYSSGDTEHLARQQESLAWALVDAAGPTSGQSVLDVGAGTGNVAIAAARRGARVTAVDITPHQVRQGIERSALEGLEIDWKVADAEALPVPDTTMDMVLSNFGVVYAARPSRAAAEITRVLKPMGTAHFTAYPADSFNGEVLRIVQRYVSSADAAPTVDEYAWSDSQALRRWFPGCSIGITEHVHYVDPQPSVDAWWEAMRGVPILERLRETLSQRDFRTFRENVIALRLRFADVAADGTVTPFNRYVNCRVDLGHAEP
ncbi:class I SAM-dependent methyltransferase [Nocardioides sp. GXQ0305]|uniref:class I SAM-dependent methyltransferase n=1 Tax=Nocardioides sp. GXQ0305 TaxID=3423912 RepID=UPI003D7E0B25